MFSKRSQIFLLNLNLRDAKSSEIMTIGLDFFSVYVNLVGMKKWKQCYNGNQRCRLAWRIKLKGLILKSESC